MKRMKELQVQGERQSSMSNLHIVSLAGWDIGYHESISVSELAPFLELPSVSHFKGPICAIGWEENTFYDRYKRKFKLESLNIQDVNFGDELPRVLELFSELKRFTYVYIDYDYPPSLKVPEHLKRCIEEFNILCLEDNWEQKLGYDDWDEVAIGDLSDFPKLKIINMPGAMLVGSWNNDPRSWNDPRADHPTPSEAEMRYPDFFCERSVERWPDSLEHLTITCCDVKIIDYLCPRFPFGKPNLRTLTFELYKDMTMELDVAKYGPKCRYDAGEKRAVLTRGEDEVEA